ncbi:MAG: hypothetical protein ACPL7A_01270, partial [Anaerolineales bacterium]
VKPSVSEKVSFRAVLYSSLPFLLAAVLDEENHHQHYLAALNRVREGYYLPATNEWSYPQWEDVRSKIIQWWFALIH